MIEVISDAWHDVILSTLWCYRHDI